MPTKGISLLGAASVVVAALALLICWIPEFGILAVPPALLAAALALCGIVVSLLGGRSRLGLPLAGGLMAVVAFVVPVARSGIVPRAAADARLKSSGGTGTGTGAGAPAAAPMTASIDDVQVRVASARVATVYASNYARESGRSLDPQLQLTLAIRNTSTSRTVNYHTWAGAQFTLDRGFATLVDDKGNVCKRVVFGGFGAAGGSNNSVQGRRLAESIPPGGAITDVLVFEPPAAGAEHLELELPGVNVASAGSARITIPVSSVSRGE